MKIRLIKNAHSFFLFTVFFLAVSMPALSQKKQTKIEVPEWALPGSKTHKQVPPPKDFHSATTTQNKRLGIFEGQSEVGGPLVPGSSSYNKATKEYTINASGYNIWYTRDEFRFLWKKMSGDISFASDIKLPDTAAFFDRKAVLIIRQSLDDDAKEIMVALHGAGLIHMAWRPAKGESMKQMRVEKKGAVRLGIEKRGDSFSLYVSHAGEPIQQYGAATTLTFDGPFYVGIGFCSHVPDKLEVGVLSNVVLENVAGKVK